MCVGVGVRWKWFGNIKGHSSSGNKRNNMNRLIKLQYLHTDNNSVLWILDSSTMHGNVCMNCSSFADCFRLEFPTNISWHVRVVFRLVHLCGGNMSCNGKTNDGNSQLPTKKSRALRTPRAGSIISTLPANIHTFSVCLWCASFVRSHRTSDCVCDRLLCSLFQSFQRSDALSAAFPLRSFTIFSFPLFRLRVH